MRKRGGIERTGKNITNRLGMPPDLCLYSSDDQRSFFETVIFLFPFTGYAQKAG
jgi:hypothetical protein